MIFYECDRLVVVEMKNRYLELPKDEREYEPTNRIASVSSMKLIYTKSL